MRAVSVLFLSFFTCALANSRTPHRRLRKNSLLPQPKVLKLIKPAPKVDNAVTALAPELQDMIYKKMDVDDLVNFRTVRRRL